LTLLKKLKKYKGLKLKMKSRVMALIAIILIAFFLTGCIQEQVKQEAKQEKQAMQAMQEPQEKQAEQAEQASEQVEAEEECWAGFGYYNEPTTNFNFDSLNWRIEKEGGITYYKTRLKFVERGGLPILITDVSFRTNPYKLKKINVSLDGWPSKQLYVSYDDAVMKCNDTMVAAVEIGLFLGFSGISTLQQKGKMKSCEDATLDTKVIVIQHKGCYPKVIEKENCITVETACLSLETVEALILRLIEIGIAEGRIEPQ